MNRSVLSNRIRLGVFWLSILLVAFFATTGHIHLSLEFFNFNDDARQQIWPLLRYKDSALFPNDYVADYYLHAFLPLGYSLFYEVMAPFVDPRLVSKVLPYLLLLVTVMSIGIVSWRLSGTSAAWLSAAIILTADIYLARMTGGLPRSFAFPLMALLFFGAASGRPLFLAVVTAIGAMFYYVVAAIGGMLLFACLFAIPASWRGAARSWSIGRRLVILISTGIVCLLMVLPAYFSAKSYGPNLTQKDVRDFPEAGIGGRYGRDDLPGAGNAFIESVKKGALTFGGQKIFSWTLYKAAKENRKFIAAAVLLMLIIGVYIVWWREISAKRLILMPLVAIAGYYVAELFSPYLFLPTRYLTYTMPLFLAAIFPAAMLAIVQRIPLLRNLPEKGVLTAVSILSLILLFGGGPSASRGLMQVQEHGIYTAISQLPKDSVVAGWPKGVIQNVPYLSERTAFLSFETHQAFHKEYTLEMRRRMQALIAAYFSLDRDKIKILNKQFGVTHLVLNREHFEGSTPEYFRPFDDALDAVLQHDTETGWEKKLARIEGAVEYRDANLVLVDLRMVEP